MEVIPSSAWASLTLWRSFRLRRLRRRLFRYGTMAGNLTAGLLRSHAVLTSVRHRPLLDGFEVDPVSRDLLGVDASEGSEWVADPAPGYDPTGLAWPPCERPRAFQSRLLLVRGPVGTLASVRCRALGGRDAGEFPLTHDHSLVQRLLGGALLAGRRLTHCLPIPLRHLSPTCP
jgi:hypothetical protein